MDKFTKIGRKYDSCLEKKCQLSQKSKAFSFPSKANTVRDKKTSCHEYIKNCLKNLMKHQSLSVSQKASTLHTTFTPASTTTSAYYIKFILQKLCFICSTGLGYRKVISFPLPVLTEKPKTFLKERVGKK